MNFITKKGQHISFEQLLIDIKNVPKKQSTILIGIDGCGGSGKTTFANKIKKACSDVTIVHMDDFYHPSSKIINAPPTEKPIGADFDWKRLLNQVLEPLSKEKEAHYQRFDWKTDRLAEWHTVPVGGIVIVEGVYAIRKELADKYDFRYGLIVRENYVFQEELKETGKQPVKCGKTIGWFLKIFMLKSINLMK
jgi:uridine kinase